MLLTPITPPVPSPSATVVCVDDRHCTYYEKDRHVEANCHKKKRDLDTQEILSLLHRMSALGPSGSAGSTTQSLGGMTPSSTSSLQIYHLGFLTLLLLFI